MLPGATPGRVKLFPSGISTAGEAGVPLPASPADEFPAEKLNPEGVASGSKTKVKNPPQKPKMLVTLITINTFGFFLPLCAPQA